MYDDIGVKTAVYVGYFYFLNNEFSHIMSVVANFTLSK